MVQAASRRREDAHAPGDEAVANTRGRQPAIDKVLLLDDSLL